MTLRRHASEIITAVQLHGYDAAMETVLKELQLIFDKGRKSGLESARQAINLLGDEAAADEVVSHLIAAE